MKNKRFSLLKIYPLFLLCLLNLFSSSSIAELSTAYSLGYGDMVSIKVYGEDDLTVEAQLNDLGVISFPFLGEVQVLGLTVTEVQKKIEVGLKDGYMIDPEVSVLVVEYRRFYVSGEVNSPGGFAFLPGLTIRKAVSLAGGFTDRAAQSKIYIISDGNSDRTPKRVQLNSSVKPGDVITVKQRFF
jgi:polysaccharide export outer membrane protein